MIPIGDDKIHNARKPVFTWLLILTNVLLFLYQRSLGFDRELIFINEYGAIPTEILAGDNLKSLFTNMFLHGGWLHLIGNMLFLYVFGDNIETVLGHVGFIVFYLMGGVAASLLHIAMNMDSSLPGIGASGAISACLGAYMIMFPRSRIHTLVPLVFIITTVRISAWIFLGYWILLQFLNSRATAVEGGEINSVAWFAHIGGFVFGFMVGIAYFRRARRHPVIKF